MTLSKLRRSSMISNDVDDDDDDDGDDDGDDDDDDDDDDDGIDVLGKVENHEIGAGGAKSKILTPRA